jgi:hypothetical protein
MESREVVALIAYLQRLGRDIQQIPDGPGTGDLLTPEVTP